MAKLITYDLRNPARNYDGLISEIKRLSNTIPITDSCWITTSIYSCIDIANHLKKQIGPEDALFVVSLMNNAAWEGKMLSPDAAIKKHLDKNQL
jgi:hypothetical protein